ncbi:MAG: GNAT family N-acetyltransferase [Candidatus Rokubacteria bacterium]|nr:GNAT family N-acetyltransferase [Candidatus Rokubacteria bacterium]
MSAARIERLSVPPAECLGALIAESEAHGLRFVRRLADEWTSGANRFDRPGEALFAARITGDVVGVCGLNVDPYAADPNVGRVRHLYVLLAHRRCGIGRQLVAEVIDAARGRFQTLRLSTVNSAAAELYERMGFRRHAGAAGCTHVMEGTMSITVRAAREADAAAGCDAIRRSIRELCVADHGNDEQDYSRIDISSSAKTISPS